MIMVANERLSQDFFRKMGLKGEDCGIYRINVTPAPKEKSSVKTLFNLKTFSTGSEFHSEEKGINVPAEIFTTGVPTKEQKAEMLSSEGFQNMKQTVIDNNDSDLIDYLTYTENQPTIEEWNEFLDLVQHENECNMKFSVWNVCTEEDEESADILVALGEKEKYIEDMLRSEMSKLGFSESQIDEELNLGDYVTFAVNTSSEQHYDLSIGGFMIANPDISSELYFLRENSEIIGTGYFFTEAEHTRICSVAKEAYLEKTEFSEEAEKEDMPEEHKYKGYER